MKKPTRERICAVVLKLLDKSGDGNGVSIRRVAAEVGITPMAIYKHFPNRDALLNGATSAEYKRIGAYFERANARKNVKGLRGMLGYLDYALDHPNLFQYMFSRVRADAYVFPGELNAGKSPTMNILYSFVGGAMESGILRKDDVFETSLSIWAHAHGVIMLYLAGRIELPKGQLRNLYLRSLNRLLDGLTAQPHKAREILKRGQMQSKKRRVATP
jgi:AcrR family transcriptional regulator